MTETEKIIKAACEYVAANVAEPDFSQCQYCFEAGAKYYKMNLSSLWYDAWLNYPELNIPQLVAYDDNGIIRYVTAYYDGEDWYTCEKEKHIRPIRWQKINTF